MEKQALILAGVVGSAIVIPTLLITQKDNFIICYITRGWNVDDLLQRFTGSIKSIIEHDYLKLFLCQFIHKETTHCLINLFSSLSALPFIAHDFGTLTTLNLCFTGHVMGIVGTFLQYRWLKSTASRWMRDFQVLGVINRVGIDARPYRDYMAQFGQWIYKVVHEDLLIYGFDFTLYSLAGFTVYNRVRKIFFALWLYEFSLITANELFAEFLFDILIISGTILSLSHPLRSIWAIYFSKPNLKILMTQSIDNPDRFNLSTGIIASFIWGIFFAYIIRY